MRCSPSLEVQMIAVPRVAGFEPALPDTLGRIDPFPHLHVRPADGWVNDPNGIGHWDGRWHVMYQWNPNAPQHGDIHWGHMSSADLLSWRDEGVVLRPRPEGLDAAGVWSGVAVPDGGGVALVYSAVPDHAWHAGVAVARRGGDGAWVQPDRRAAEHPDRSRWRAVREPFVLLPGARGVGLLGAWHLRRAFLDASLRRIDPRPDLRVITIAAVAGGVLLFLTVERYLVLQRAAPNARGAIWQPMVRARLRADLPKTLTKPMNEKMIAMLVAFFVIQLSIYLIGLARLRGVRNQDADPQLKLRLIDNEEALFDAPLYMGIAGSVLALVLRLTGFEGISLMASYSSTLFGILFRFILKVMHVRPYRQQLILESAEYPPA